MQAVVEVPQAAPQTGSEPVEKPQVPAQEQAVKEDESRNINRQIRNISAFCDCV
jgi:hypothetical protein